MKSQLGVNHARSTELTRCPGCGGSKSSVIGGQASSFRVAVGDETFAQAAYWLNCCQLCGIYYKSNVAEEGTLSRYYSLVDFRKWEICGLFPTEREALKILRRLPAGSQVLDFGCSSGRLLHGLVNDYKCLGYEINPEAAMMAANKGIQMVEAPAAIPQGSLDALVMSDVFEHLSNPTEVIEGLALLIRPGGLLIISTGNADAPAFQKCAEYSWYLRTIEHLVVFSRRYAEFLSGKLDAKLMVWVEVSHYDWNIRVNTKQWIQNFAYWSIQNERTGWISKLMAHLPYTKRAQNWKEPPTFNCTRDHVLACFQLSGRQVI